MTETVSTVKNHLVFEVMLNQELLDYLNHFLVSPGETGTSQANSDLRFIVFHPSS
jgi:hypothetical protein